MSESSIVFENSARRQTLRVPREDQSLFASPSVPEAVELAFENRKRLESSNINVQGRTLEHLRNWSRGQAYQAAQRYTARLVQHTLPDRSFELLVVAGHQPSLFHPGVWIKNFALDRLAASTQGVGLNLVVDNDTLSSTRIRVPTSLHGSPTTKQVAFDGERPLEPWEGAQVLDEKTFREFDHRVAKLMGECGIVPLVTQLWPAAVDCLSQSRLLRDCLTAARHRLERSWGVSNLELPVSQLCDLEPFQWFASHVLAHLDRFHQVHNHVLQDFKRVYKIRSRTHPVPDLNRIDDWLEAPFWVWKTGDLKRGRVFARQMGREVWLATAGDVFAKLPLTPTMDACCAVEVLQDLTKQGYHLRTRALTTTLFSRVCLADLFVHGIGGAKYDEMTDRIIAQFFRIEPPRFLTLSATLHLPLAAGEPVEPADISRLRVLKRDLVYNAQRHLTPGISSDIDTLLARKSQLIAAQAVSRTRGPSGLSRRERRQHAKHNFERFRELQQINQRLSKFVTGQQTAVDLELQDAQRRLQERAVQQDRDYAYCLYPEDKIRRFLTGEWKT